MENLEAAFPFLFLVFFVLFWIFVLGLLSRLSGWSTLADHYKSDQSLNGSKRRLQSMSMGSSSFMNVGYGNIVTLEVNADYLALSLMFLFQPGHHRIVIPLDELTAEPHKIFFILKGVRFSTVKAPAIKITTTRSWAKWIEEKTNGRWSVQSELNFFPAH